MSKHKKRKRSHSSNSSDEERRKAKKSKKEKKSKKHKKSKKESKDIKKDKSPEKPKASTSEQNEPEESFDIPLNFMDKSKSMAPITKEEWDKKQSVTKRVFDESTGRYRLIKGDGEVIEEIVSRERHLAINQQATKGDGDYFQAKLSLKK